MMAAMDAGNADLFFAQWAKHVPEAVRTGDPTSLKIEFYLQMIFAVYPVPHSLPHPCKPISMTVTTPLEEDYTVGCWRPF